MHDRIRSVLARHGRLAVDAATLDSTADLYAVGLTSHASVSLMLALEDAFGVEFPESMLTRATFGSIAAIADALGVLGTSEAAA
jgi:acyl carrier protein